MKPVLWITACCAGLSVFEALAGEDYTPPASHQVIPESPEEQWTAPPGDPVPSPAAASGTGYGAMPGYQGADAPRGIAHPPQWINTSDRGAPMIPPEAGGLAPSAPADYPPGQSWRDPAGQAGYHDPGYGYPPARPYQYPQGYGDTGGYDYAPPPQRYGYPSAQTYGGQQD